MKETIEAWAVVRDGGISDFFDTENDAKFNVSHHGGTVVRLTGEVPRQLRKVSTEVWIQPMKPIEYHTQLLQFRLGIEDWDPENKENCTIRARITMEELGE